MDKNVLLNLISFGVVGVMLYRSKDSLRDYWVNYKHKKHCKDINTPFLFKCLICHKVLAELQEQQVFDEQVTSYLQYQKKNVKGD